MRTDNASAFPQGIRPVTGVFVGLLLSLMAATVAYWFLILDPRLHQEAETTAGAIAHAQSTVVNHFLSESSLSVDEREPALRALLQEMLLLTDQNTGQPFVNAVTLEFSDGTQMTVTSRGRCQNCFVTEVPLYDGRSGELFGVMQVHSDPTFDEAMRTDARRGLFGWLLGVLLLTGLGWRIMLMYQRRVRDSESYTQAVFDASPLPLILATVEDHSVLGLNRAARNFLGEVTVLPDSLGSMLQADGTWNDAAEPVEPFSRGINDAYVPTANGSLCPVLVHVAPVSLGGVGRLVISLVDISDRKRSEDQLYEARDRAESASRAKGAFLAAMSHEVRTPLHGIMGFTDLLKRSGLESSQQEYLELIRVSASNLLEVIEEILDFSRIEAGKIEVSKEPFNIAHELRSVVSLFQPKAQNKGYELQLKLADTLPDRVVSDVKRVRQIVGILIDNAIKFTDRGGVQVLAQASKGRISLSVIDTGIGIAEEHLEQLFEPFYQVEQGATRSYGGTGLGLVIARNFARRLGGDVRVESEPGAGSRFILQLPIGLD